MGTATSEIKAVPQKQSCVSLYKGIKFYRGATWKIQDRLGVKRTKISKKPITSCKYALWVATLWKARTKAWREIERQLKDPVVAIRVVFGGHSEEALSVASCESGHTYSVNAQNGQYLGIFQMGSNERETYGHGNTPYAQAKAAHRYFVASGRDWSPWECKPY